MRIGVNANILSVPKTGIGCYVSELVKALTEDFNIDVALLENSFHAKSRLHKISELLKCSSTYQIKRKLEQRKFNHWVNSNKFDIYHEPTLWPLQFNGPTICTVHDLSHLITPIVHPKSRIKEIEKRIYNSLEQSLKVLTPSFFTANELNQHYSVPLKKITVTPLGFAKRFYPRQAEELKEPLIPFGLKPFQYLLFVGTIEPRKNLAVILQAYARLPEKVRSHYPLVIVGMKGWDFKSISKELSQGIKSGFVKWLGYQNDNLVAALTAGATLMLYPSLYEGFGLPVLEAMASKTAVITSPVSSLPEVGGNAVAYAHTNDVMAWSECIEALIDDEQLRHEYETKGLNQAQRFSWNNCARLTLDAYSEVANALGN